jgi:Asp-tRNA(Asn)/Glu-tRNA(Gln) amidotransferase A subunit family amidase
MSHLRDTVGPLAVSMDDVAFLDEVVTNERHNTTLLPSQIRIGVPHQNYYEDLDPEV